MGQAVIPEGARPWSGAQEQGAPLRVIPEGARRWEDIQALERLRDQRRLPAMSGLDGSSPLERIVAGVQRGVNNFGLGIRQSASHVGQYLGGETPADVQAAVDRADQRDAPLLATPQGQLGNIIGGASMALLPGAGLQAAGKLAQAPALVRAGAGLLTPSTYKGSAATGALFGALEPVTSHDRQDSMLPPVVRNAAIGAAGGAAGLLGGNALAGVAQGAKALVEPLYPSGRQLVTGRLLREVSADPAAAEAALRAHIADPSALSKTPGYRPTLAEITLDPGLAAAQAAATGQARFALKNRQIENNGAIAGAINKIAGTDDQMSTAQALRDYMSGGFYDRALDAPLNVQQIATMADDISALAQRPAMKSAMETARKLAGNEGVPLTNATSMQGLHWSRLGLNDNISAAAKGVAAGTSSVGPAELRSLMSTKGALDDVMSRLSPDYATGLQNYATFSRPINAMDVGRHLREKVLPELMRVGQPVGEAGGDIVTRLRPEAYAKALNDAQGTVAQATGLKINNGLSEYLNPADVATLEGVGTDLRRGATAEDLAKTTQSPTMQNLAMGNVTSRLFGPLGSPGSVAMTGPAGQVLSIWPLKGAIEAAQGPMERALGQAMTDPAAAVEALTKAQPGWWQKGTKMVAPMVSATTAPTAVQLYQ